MKRVNLAYQRGFKAGTIEREKYAGALVFPCPHHKDTLSEKYRAWVKDGTRPNTAHNQEER